MLQMPHRSVEAPVGVEAQPEIGHAGSGACRTRCSAGRRQKGTGQRRQEEEGRADADAVVDDPCPGAPWQGADFAARLMGVRPHLEQPELDDAERHQDQEERDRQSAP